MKIAVVGCGGIGGVMAGVMAQKRQSITCVTGRDESARILNERGIHIRGKMGEMEAGVSAHRALKEGLGPFDVIIIAVKSNQLRQVFEDAKDYLCESGFISTVQNGIEMLDLGGEFPDVKLIAGAVGFNSIMIDYGHYFVTSRGSITVGVLGRGTEDDVFILKSLFEPAIKVKTTGKLDGVLWSKLLIVCGVTGLGGAAGLRVGHLLRHRVSRRLFYAIVTEGASVARQLGISLERFGGAINPERFGNHDRGFPLFLRYILLKILGMKYRNLKSNIHHSIERDRPTEVYYINGALVREGARLGIDTPVNRELVRVIEEIERHERRMSMENLLEIWGKLVKER